MGKLWFITGAASGLGAAIARAVIQSGDRVVATGRDKVFVAGSAAAASLVKPYCGSLTTGGDSDEDERSFRPTFP
jgi:NAD(P)-dependent dehydrogenase (short-subunit alcohol dehydrogenase family)